MADHVTRLDVPEETQYELYALIQMVIFERTYGATDWQTALRLLRGDGALWDDPESQGLIDALLDSAVNLGVALRLVEATQNRPLFGTQYADAQQSYLARVQQRSQIAMADHLSAYTRFTTKLAQFYREELQHRRAVVPVT